VITMRDTISLFMSNMKQRKYEFEFVPAMFSNKALMAELVDSYMNTRSLLSVVDTTVIPFNITADPASAAADRFMIVFGPQLAPDMDISIKAEVKNSGVLVNWTAGNETGLDRYELERSFNGTSFTGIYTKAVSGNSPAPVNYNRVDSNPRAGINYYRIKAIHKNGLSKYSDIASVNFVKGQPAVSVYPNPVNGNSFSLQLNDIEKGSYSVTIINSIGQRVYAKEIQHNGIRSGITIAPGPLAKGTYELVVKGKNIQLTEKIIKQ
jgi:hypothetical protein